MGTKRQLAELNSPYLESQKPGNFLYHQPVKHARIELSTDSGLGTSLLNSPYGQQLSFASPPITLLSPKQEPSWSNAPAPVPTPLSLAPQLHHSPLFEAGFNSFVSPSAPQTVPYLPQNTGGLWPSYHTNVQTGAHELTLSTPQNATEYRFDGKRVSSLQKGGLIRIGSPESASLSTPKCQRSLNRCLSENITSPRHHTPVNRQISAHPALTEANRVCTTTPQPSAADFFGGYSLSTSTPVRTHLQQSSNTIPLHSHSNLTLPPSTSQQQHTGPLIRPVFPSSPKNKASSGAVPRTPTPFKKAMAAIERRQGRLQAIVTPEHPSQVAQDLREIIQQERCLSVRSPNHRSNVSDTTLNFNVTPSKLVLDSNADFSPPSLVKTYRNSECSDSYLHETAWDDEIPEKTPERLSSKWLEITCGQTRSQRLLTAQAKRFLGLEL